MKLVIVKASDSNAQIESIKFNEEGIAILNDSDAFTIVGKLQAYLMNKRMTDLSCHSDFESDVYTLSSDKETLFEVSSIIITNDLNKGLKEFMSIWNSTINEDEEKEEEFIPKTFKAPHRQKISIYNSGLPENLCKKLFGMRIRTVSELGHTNNKQLKDLLTEEEFAKVKAVKYEYNKAVHPNYNRHANKKVNNFGRNKHRTISDIGLSPRAVKFCMNHGLTTPSHLERTNIARLTTLVNKSSMYKRKELLNELLSMKTTLGKKGSK